MSLAESLLVVPVKSSWLEAKEEEKLDCLVLHQPSPSIYFTYHWFDWLRGLSLQLLVTISRSTPLSIILWWFLLRYSLTTYSLVVFPRSHGEADSIRSQGFPDSNHYKTFLSCNKPINKFADNFSDFWNSHPTDSGSRLVNFGRYEQRLLRFHKLGKLVICITYFTWICQFQLSLEDIWWYLFNFCKTSWSMVFLAFTK